MSCVLRIAGTQLDTDRVMNDLAVAPNRVDQVEVRSGRVRPAGLHFEIDATDFATLSAQCERAVAFLAAHHSWISKLAAADGVEYAEIDFGVEQDDGPMFTNRLSSELIRWAARCGLSIAISSYRVK